jgi:K+-transporting ATPase ATPase C chain
VINQFRAACTVLGLLALLTGLAYPMLVMGLAQALFPYRANGSVIEKGGKAIGSELIGQRFDDNPRYFWGRPSATGPAPYTAFNAQTMTGSSGSNLGPTNPDLVGDKDPEKKPGLIRERIKNLRDADKKNKAPIPIDLVTASASGLDPHISPAAAEYQVARVAKARDINPEVVRRLVAAHTEGRTLGLLGEPRVNVLRLNLALDEARAR